MTTTALPPAPAVASPAGPRAARRQGVVGLVDRLSAVLDARTSRRGFLARSAVVGSALAVGPVDFLLKPGTAYAAVCGSDATCDSGYTVFCVTINGGVNRCPPNALVGGWWKADNSGFCCGSARYYIDCHSYCSCGCGGGSAFCGESCRSCSCGCGPRDSCDQRKVCCNEFRYGQCMQHVSCTGPVWCRVVSCTPPWKVPAWECTTTSATDPRTGSHTAPGLPYCSGIDQLYASLGGPGSFLGEATTGERPGAGGGAYNNFDGGSILWSGATGAHELHGAILGAYRALGAESGGLGYPTTSELRTADGRGAYNDFSGSGGATILWRSDLGAHAVWGAIRGQWLALGGVLGPLGYPATSETAAPDGTGRYNDFVGPGGPGSVCFRADVGAHAVWGAVHGEWSRLGGLAGPLGYPTSSEVGSTDGKGVYETFSGPAGAGSVHWSPATGAHSLFGAIRGRWVELGGEDGPIGRPVTSEGDAPGGRGGRFNDFVGPGTATSPGATITWSPATGAHSVRGPVRTAWLGVDGSAGRLGYPTVEPVRLPTGRLRSDFEGGTIVLDPATGQTTITYT